MEAMTEPAALPEKVEPKRHKLPVRDRVFELVAHSTKEELLDFAEALILSGREKVRYQRLPAEQEELRAHLEVLLYRADLMLCMSILKCDDAAFVDSLNPDEKAEIIQAQSTLNGLNATLQFVKSDRLVAAAYVDGMMER